MECNNWNAFCIHSASNFNDTCTPVHCTLVHCTLYIHSITHATINSFGLQRNSDKFHFVSIIKITNKKMLRCMHTLVVQKQHSNSVGTSASITFSFLCLAACSIAICRRSSATSYLLTIAATTIINKIIIDQLLLKGWKKKKK